ncbi:MAG: carbonic anhydrase [Gammaproteobacteria bacterium]|jgi:carbonic anhydrase
MTDLVKDPETDGLDVLIERNARWSSRMVEATPDYFSRLTNQQSPAYLWIGCSDSRVPANQIIDLPPGEVFVHRNVANLVYDADINVQSVIEYAVDVIKVRHIIVCGHYGCGGIQAALANRSTGLVENWLRPVRRLSRRMDTEFTNIESPTERVNRLCELNVIEQVQHVREATAVQNALDAGRPLSIHGVVYGLEDGRLRVLVSDSD